MAYVGLLSCMYSTLLFALGTETSLTLGICFGWIWRSLIHDLHTCIHFWYIAPAMRHEFKVEYICKTLSHIDPVVTSGRNSWDHQSLYKTPLAAIRRTTLDRYISTPPLLLTKAISQWGNCSPSNSSHGFTIYFCFWHVKFPLINSRALCSPNIYLDIANFNGLMQA